MGIKGLTTFINTQRWIYEMHMLHDTKVVIDGNNIYHHLYGNSKNASFFGGDFDDFIFHTETFFKQFELCKIIPIIILDGASGDSKLDCLKRSYQKNVMCFIAGTDQVYTMSVEKDITLSNVLLAEVFDEIMEELNIKTTRSMFEADDDIAAVAKILRIPVISMDSDFFIYNNDFIPLRKIRVGFEQGQTPDSFVKKCLYFKPHFFNKMYPDLDLTTLPLLSTLLGNDYCSQDFFTEFYDRIKGQTDLENDPINLARIKLILDWLDKKTLHEAIDELFSVMPKEKHEQMLNVMEHIFGMLKIFPVEILQALNFPQEEIDRISELLKKESCSILKPFHQKVLKKEKMESDNSKTSFVDKIPEWFKKEIFAGRYQRTISSILTDEVYMQKVFPQDYLTLPSIRCITHPVIALIKRLITKGVMEYEPFTYYGITSVKVEEEKEEEYEEEKEEEKEKEEIKKKERKEKKVVEEEEEFILTVKFGVNVTNCREIIPPENLPSIHELRDWSYKERKAIMDKALGVTPEMRLELLSKPWQLYIGIVFYWLKEDVQPKRNEYHAYAAMFLVLKGIVNTKLKSQQVSWRRSESNNENSPQDLDSVIAGICKNDCNLIKRLIEEKSGEDSQPREFKNVKLVNIHIYNMFQYCLKDLICLNKILGNVYENPSLKFLLSGTLFYHLYEDFKGRVDIDRYIEEKLQNAQSFLRIFKILMGQLKKMCNKAKLKFFAPVKQISRNVSFAAPRNMFFPFHKQ